MIMLMETVIMYVILVVLGLVLGSFAGATLWRLRAKQLEADKRDGEDVSGREYKMLQPLLKTTMVDDRSRCLHCGHTLSWYDLIPLASWLSTKGKCRYCKKPIGWLEPVIELTMAAFFVLSFAFWPEALTTAKGSLEFGLWLIAGVMLVILFFYDLRWYLLPNRIVFPLIGVAMIMAVMNVTTAIDPLTAVISLVFSAAILSGIYLVLWAASKGAWIGFGDVKLGLALALLLGQWPLAFVALFGANIIGCLIVLPGMLSGKITRKTRVPFGPLLIAGGFIAMLWGHQVVNLYFMALV